VIGYLFYGAILIDDEIEKLLFDETGNFGIFLIASFRNILTNQR
jgi:hypothetical protein